MLKTRENLLTEDQRKTLEAKQKTEEQKKRKLIADINQTFGTGHGMNVLRWLMEECGVFKSPIIVDQQTWDVKDKAMIYNGGRVSVYLSIRKYLDPKITGPVENNGLAKDEEIDLLS